MYSYWQSDQYNKITVVCRTTFGSNFSVCVLTCTTLSFVITFFFNKPRVVQFCVSTFSRHVPPTKICILRSCHHIIIIFFTIIIIPLAQNITLNRFPIISVQQTRDVYDRLIYSKCIPRPQFFPHQWPAARRFNIILCAARCRGAVAPER